MNEKFNCDIILDLLPLSLESMTSKETDEIIREHLQQCENCKQIYEDMSRDIHLISPKKRKEKHKYKKKNFMRLFILGYLLFLLSIIAFCIIDVCLFL